MFTRIMVPLDGSRFSEWALTYATDLSRRTGAKLDLVSVHEPIPSFAYDEWETAALDWTTEYLDRIRDRLNQELEAEVTSWVGNGPVLEGLLQRADSQGVDLIVAATHGRGAISRAWLGSIADGLLRHGDHPLLLVRPEKGEQPPSEPTLGRVVVPLDGSDFSEKALAPAASLARLYDGRLHLVRVVAYPVEIASPYLPHTVQMNQEVVHEARDAAQAYLDRIADELGTDGLETRADVIVDSQAGAAICEELGEAHADVIVMASHGRSGIRRALLGSTADKVIRSSHNPVLVIRPGEKS